MSQLVVKDLYKYYPAGVASKDYSSLKKTKYLALSNISFEVKAGEIFGLIGKSGAGKSTLLRCLNGLEEPSSGEVIVAGQNISELSSVQLRKLRQNIGMIWQQFNLLNSRDAYHNISLPLELAGWDKQNIDNRVLELLSFVGLTDFAHKYPKTLSGGQRQRVAIARALALNPKILLCDEATSALDPETTQEILTLLKQVNKKLKVSIVFITHQMSVVRKICDRVGVLDAGALVEVGPVVNVFVEPKSQVAQNLAQEIFPLNLPEKVVKRLAASSGSSSSSNPLLRLVFMGKAAEVPVSSVLLEKFAIKSNILSADIGQIGNKTVGFTVVQWQLEDKTNAKENIKLAKEYLKSLDIKIKELGYV